MSQPIDFVDFLPIATRWKGKNIQGHLNTSTTAAHSIPSSTRI